MGVERIVLEVLRASGGVQSAIRHVSDSSRHLDDLVIEVLDGAVNDANRTFLASRLTLSGSVPLLIFRRQVLQEDDGFEHANNGRAFILDSTPKSSEDTVDLPPIAIYLASTNPVVEITAETVGMFGRRRHACRMEDEPPPRRKRVMPV